MDGSEIARKSRSHGKLKPGYRITGWRGRYFMLSMQAVASASFCRTSFCVVPYGSAATCCPSPIPPTGVTRFPTSIFCAGVFVPLPLAFLLPAIVVVPFSPALPDRGIPSLRFLRNGRPHFIYDLFGAVPLLSVYDTLRTDCIPETVRLYYNNQAVKVS